MLYKSANHLPAVGYLGCFDAKINRLEYLFMESNAEYNNLQSTTNNNLNNKHGSMPN
jgi:hypothetical protein